MTSNKSLFNFGIFKNTIKRFKWGSFLYFIILFFSLPFIIMVQEKEYLLDSYNLLTESTPIILESGFMAIPIFLAMVVPTIVATLCFNSVHSAKHGNFVHALPVTRLNNYISTVLAGLTLIIVPVLLNAGILLIMNLTGYREIITFSSIVYWFFLNISISFIMLSVSAFSAYLTGHTAAHIAINLLIHTAPLIIALGIYLISDTFLFGFSESDNFIANEILNNTPMVWLYSNTIDYRENLNLFTKPQMWVFIGMAITFYVLAFVLYKKRKLESCGDVAAFNVFKPILKYTATVFAAILIFGILVSTDLGAAPVFTVATVTTAVVYFASEMLIRKTVKVFNSYKGYLGFAVFMAIFISIFAYTDIFGYERRIPEHADIESATIYHRYSDNIPMVADNKLIEDVRTMHKEFISNIPVTENNPERHTRLSVKYNLKNGKVINREYNVTEEVQKRALSKMYETPEYKNIVYSFDILNIEKVKNMDLRLSTSTFSHHIAVNEDAQKILTAVKKDLALLSYDEIECQQFGINISFFISQSAEDNEKSQIFDTTTYGDSYYPYRMYSLSMEINSNFKNTFDVLQEQGYFHEFITDFSKNVKLCTIPVYVKDNVFTYKNDTGEYYEFLVNTNDCAVLNPEDASKITETLLYVPVNYNEKSGNLPDGTYYMVFCHTDDYQTLDLASHCYAFTEENMPEYLKKYVTQKIKK